MKRSQRDGGDNLYRQLSARGKEYLDEVFSHGSEPNESTGGHAGRQGERARLARLWSRLSPTDQNLIRRLLS